MKKIIFILTIILSQSSYAQLNKLLDSVINNAASRINNQVPAVEVNKPTVEIKKNSQPVNLNSSSIYSSSSMETVCKGITNSKFQEYLEQINILNEAEANHMDISYKYDTSDRAVARWIEEQLKTISEDDRKNGRRINQTIDSWLIETNKCAFQVFQIQPNSMKLFVTDKRQYKYISEKLKTAKDIFASRNAKIRTLSDSPESEATNKQKTESTDKFKWLNDTKSFVDTSTYRSFLASYDRAYISDEAIIPLLLLLDSDGKITAKIHDDVMNELRKKVDKQKAQKAEWDAQFLAQKADDEKREKAQKERDKQLESYFLSLKNGNYRAAKSCIDIISATDADDGLLASIKPHQKLKSGAGTLTRYKNDIVGDGGVGLILGKGYGAEIRATKNTIWINRDAIQIGASVVVIGKYIDNIQIKLANGSAYQSPVLELVCIEPN